MSSLFFLLTTVVLFFILRIDHMQVLKHAIEGFTASNYSDLLGRADRLFAVVSVLVGLLAFLYGMLGRRFTDFVFRYRYVIALAIFALCVALGVTGSSLGCYRDQLGGGGDYDIVAGVSRPVRSDEWVVYTPMAWAQYVDPSGAFPYYSTIFRGTLTDAFLGYGQPVKSFLMIFRPFQIGYLFLPVDNGMAFFWCGRQIALFMVSFEFGRLITGDRRLPAAIYAGFAAFAPPILWWFAICGFVEMVISVQLIPVLVATAVRTEKRSVRLLSIAGAFWALGVFFFTLYPAWMIPFFYVIIALTAAVLVVEVRVRRTRIASIQEGPANEGEGAKGRAGADFGGEEIPVNSKASEHGKKVAILPAKERRLALLVGILSFAFVAASLLYMLYMSRDELYAVMHTTYPGARVQNGGGNFLRLFNYISNIFHPIVGDGTFMNACEAAVFFSFFPVSAILPIIARIRGRKRDPLTIGLFIVGTAIFCWLVFGFPTALSKVTLFSRSTWRRMLVPFSFINLVLFFRGLSLLLEINSTARLSAVDRSGGGASVESGAEEGAPAKGFASSVLFKLLISAAIAAWVVALQYAVKPSYFRPWKLAFMWAILFALFSATAFIGKKGALRLFTLTSAGIILMSGLFVNPLRTGCDAVREIAPYRLMERNNARDSSDLWAMDGPFILGGVAMMAGVPAVNSCNIYPDLERWTSIDGGADDSAVYNRYAHIYVDIVPYISEDEKFEKVQFDVFRVHLAPADVKKLGIRKIFSGRDDLESAGPYRLIDSEGGWYVYEVEY